MTTIKLTGKTVTVSYWCQYDDFTRGQWGLPLMREQEQYHCEHCGVELDSGYECQACIKKQVAVPPACCVIAVSPNYWGRGSTVEQAKAALRRAGGKVAGCELRFIVGDDKAYIDDLGNLMIDRYAQSFKI